MKRASTAQKKETRRAAIVAQARAYIATRSFDEVRLADVARTLRLVKGTLYLYFPTKQDLFVSILVEEMEAWWKSVEARRATRSPGADLSRGLAERPLLVRLLASLHMSIEPGLSLARLRRMKEWFRDFALRAASDVEQRYPGITGKGFLFLMGVYALTVGTSQLSFPPERVQALLEAEDSLSLFRIDFADFLHRAVDALYRGMCRPGSAAR